MKAPSESLSPSEIVDLLAELLHSSPKAIRLRASGSATGLNYSLAAPGQRFLMEYKSSASAGPVAAAIGRLKQRSEADKERGVALMVVPFMGEVGRALCERSGISWLDLSGNARIVTPGLQIRIEGRPNKYIDRGRPPNIFAPKSSRIVRQLLFHPTQFQSQTALARQTGLDDGYVSKIVRRLDQASYVERNEDGAVRPHDPNLLLDAWQSTYDFSHHRIAKGHVPTRSGEELLHKVVREFTEHKTEYTATALAAAWLYTGFAAFRLVTLYLSAMPTRALLKRIEFAEEPKGANLWLVVPDDEGVLEGSQMRSGIPCVSPIQTYLDLKGQPERAKDAAVELRKKLLHWEQHEK